MLDQQNDWEIIETVLKYVINANNVTPDDLLKVVQTELPFETEEKIMTTAEQLIAQGVQQGMQQGEQQGC